jgi:hypothetical protein
MMAMLQDPENPYEEWSEEVWAVNLEVARKQCQFLAGEDLTIVLDVTQKTKTPSKNGTFKFICWFRTEKANNGTNDSNDFRD